MTGHLGMTPKPACHSLSSRHAMILLIERPKALPKSCEIVARCAYCLLSIVGNVTGTKFS